MEDQLCLTFRSQSTRSDSQVPSASPRGSLVGDYFAFEQATKLGQVQAMVHVQGCGIKGFIQPLP